MGNAKIKESVNRRSGNNGEEEEMKMNKQFEKRISEKKCFRNKWKEKTRKQGERKGVGWKDGERSVKEKRR